MLFYIQKHLRRERRCYAGRSLQLIGLVRRKEKKRRFGFVLEGEEGIRFRRIEFVIEIALSDKITNFPLRTIVQMEKGILGRVVTPALRIPEPLDKNMEEVEIERPEQFLRFQE